MGICRRRAPQTREQKAQRARSRDMPGAVKAQPDGQCGWRRRVNSGGGAVSTQLACVRAGRSTGQGGGASVSAGALSLCEWEGNRWKVPSRATATRPGFHFHRLVPASASRMHRGGRGQIRGHHFGGWSSNLGEKRWAGPERWRWAADTGLKSGGVLEVELTWDLSMDSTCK